MNIYGLAYGEYYILETKAPAGYTLMGEAVKLIIDKDTHTPEKLLTVENINGTVLPSTGGPGSEIYLITGLILLCGAAFFLFIRKAKTTS
ncbi:MAG: LPXTG cell wall anchor domain-containing protein [Oscillospiraceae bacterium]|nr:LPXTG cell wall anchor domain-containing protein [Oscillospiraceae bacterium]